MTYRPLCLAVQPGYWGLFPARCALTRPHPGTDHSTSNTPIGMGWRAHPTTWPNTDPVSDAPEGTAA